MDPQSKYVPNQPTDDVKPPTLPVASTPKKTKSSNKTLLVVGLVIAGLAMLGGLAYTNVLLKQSNDKISNLNSHMTQVDGKTAKLEEISKKGGSDELLGFDKVDKAGYQSLFLDGGQVYFGKITSMTSENFVLEDIYYLRVNGQTQANPSQTSTSQDISLVKLGCELHKPQDKMTIIRSNVQFWENLKDNDKAGVVQAILDYKKSQS